MKRKIFDDYFEGKENTNFEYKFERIRIPMKLQLVNISQADKLKYLGFDWEDGCSMAFFEFGGEAPRPFSSTSRTMSPVFLLCPEVSLAIKWLRDEKDVHIEITHDYFVYDVLIHSFGGEDKIKLTSTIGNHTDFCFTTYEQAESAALDYALDYLINERKEQISPKDMGDNKEA